MFDKKSIIKIYRNKGNLRDSLIESNFDKPLIAVLAGSIAAIIKAIISIIGKYYGYAIWDLIQISSAILTHNQVKGFGGFILGWIVTLVMGSLIGVVIYYSLYFLGRDYIILKSIGISIVFWFIDILTAIPLGIPKQVHTSYMHFLVYLLSAIIFGIVYGYILNKIAFNNHSSEGTS
jgi:hypothetical protein